MHVKYKAKYLAVMILGTVFLRLNFVFWEEIVFVEIDPTEVELRRLGRRKRRTQTLADGKSDEDDLGPSDEEDTGN